MSMRLGLGIGIGVGLVATAMLLGPGCVVVGDDGSGDEGAPGTSGAEGGPSDGADGASTGDLDPEVPAGEYCDPVTAWTPAERAFEVEVVELVNAARAQARSCGGESFGATTPLVMEPRLRCAARVHSLDMATRGFFDHTNPDGQSPFDRMALAGYSYSAAGENIAAGQVDPSEVVAGWLDSPGHCSNIMSADYSEIGVGYYFAAEQGEFPHYWTQTFGTER